MTDELLERLLDWPYQGETMAHEAADRIETLQAQNLRLSGMVHDLRKEVAISDALLISEAEASLARLARAEKAEAERDWLRAALKAIVVGVDEDFDEATQQNVTTWFSDQDMQDIARAALKGEGHE